MRLREISRGTTSLWLGILLLFIACSVTSAFAATETINYTCDDAYRLPQVASDSEYVEALYL